MNLRSADSASSARSKQRWDPVWDTIVLLVLVLFAGLRVGVGTDYSLYVEVFRRLDPQHWSYWEENSPQDWGFTELQLLIRTQTADPKWMFLTVSLISVSLVVIGIRQKSSYYPLAMWLYICLGSYLLPFNVARQGMAASIVFFAALSFLDSKRYMYGLLCFAATTVHASAAPIAILLFLARNWRPNGRTATLVLVIAVGVATYLSNFSWFIDTLGVLNDRYSSYEEINTGIGTYLVILAKICLIALCFAKGGSLTDLDRRYLLFSTFGVASLIVGTQSLVFARLDNYFALFLVLAVPNVARRTRSRSIAVAAWAGSFIYLGVLVTNYGGLVGYSFAL